MPSPEVVRKALDLVAATRANYDYFFSQLTEPDWLTPLREKGFFLHPPKPRVEGDRISFPSWPESWYLARVAAAAPNEVAAVMAKIPETNNIRVHQDLVHAATKLPGPLAAKWSSREAAWVRAQEYLYFLAEPLGQLIVHLSVSNESRAALRLARAVFSIRSLDDESRPIARMDAWEYGQTIELVFPTLLRNQPQSSFALLLDLVAAALRPRNDCEECGECGECDEDYSWIWRPAIEPHEQNHGYDDLRDSLTDAIRDGSQQMVEGGEDLEWVLDALLARERPIFVRLAMHLLAENSAHPRARVSAVNRQHFFDHRIHHEYTRLLASVFPTLAAADRTEILGWVDEGLDLGPAGDDVDPDRRRSIKAVWQARRLHGLLSHLPPDWVQRYRSIVAEFGEPEHPDFESYSTTSQGPQSPIEGGELEAMSTPQIVTCLTSWQPQDEWSSPTREGLGRALQAAVAKAPGRFVEDLPRFQLPEPTYARNLVHGIEEAAKAGTTLSWAGIVDYLEWIVRHPREEARRSTGRLDHDPHWGWARRAVANLLQLAFEKNLLEFALRERVWEIVVTIASDPDPTEEDDSSWSMDPGTQSLNTTRGQALHAVVLYALWVRRCANEDEASFGMDKIPEVQRELERHLDPSIERSPAVRAVYGRWFPWLLLLDREWATRAMKPIFPNGDERLRDAAWLTYLSYSRLYDDSFQVLRQQYRAAVGRLAPNPQQEKSWADRATSRLGQHLMVMTSRSVVRWDDNDGLLPTYFDNATLEDAGNAIASVGRSLRHEREALAADVEAALREFWNQLAATIFEKGGERVDMLSSFGWWFASGRFDTEWAFDQMDRVVTATGAVNPDSLVIERLAELAPQNPRRCLKVLRAAALQGKSGWILSLPDSKARIVLRAALADARSRSDAESLIHELGARGHTQLRDLLVSKPPSGHDRSTR